MVVVRVSPSECITPDERNPGFNRNSNLNTTGTDFEALLEDIDKELSHDGKESEMAETNVGPKRKFSTVNNLDGEGCE